MTPLDDHGDIPLDDRGIAIEAAFSRLKAAVAEVGTENVEALALILVRKDPTASWCEFAGRPAVALIGVVELLFECLNRVEPDREKRRALLDKPFEEALKEIAMNADAE